jgi:hypothetical protein
MHNQTWKHTIEPQKLLGETWKQIGSIRKVHRKWKAKLDSPIVSNALKLEWNTKPDAFIVCNKLLKYLKDDNPSLVVELLLNLIVSLLHPQIPFYDCKISIFIM